MKPKLLVVLALGVAVGVACLPVFAHHGAAAYDVGKRVTLKGSIKEWSWSNPHCLLQLDTVGDGGQVVHWIIETQNPLTMANLGWSNQSLRPGDQVTATVVPAKNGRLIGQLVDIVLANGQKLNAVHGLEGSITNDPTKSDASPKP